MYNKRLEKINEIEKELITLYGDIESISRDMLFKYINENCIVGYKYHTATYLMHHVNKTLDINNNPNTFKIKEFGLELTGDGYISKDEIVTLVNALDNPQDQFILYGLFSGLYGEQADELRELKVNQVDLKNNVIKLKDRDFKIDYLLEEILKKTIKEHTYYVIDNGNLWRTTKFELNMNSIYVIKQRPSTRNNNGLNNMMWNGLRTRVTNIMEFLGEDLSIKKIVRSGYVYRISKEVDYITSENIRKWLKENNISGTPAAFQKIYEQLYKK